MTFRTWFNSVIPNNYYQIAIDKQAQQIRRRSAILNKLSFKTKFRKR